MAAVTNLLGLLGDAGSALALLAAGPTQVSKHDSPILDMLGGLGIYIPLVIANLVVFLLFFAIVRKVLFERVRSHMATRADELERGRAEVAKLAAEREAVAAQLGAERAALDKQAYERTQEQVRRGVERKAEATQKAQEEAQARVREVRRQCAAEERDALVAGRLVIRDLALEMVRIAAAGTLDPKSVEGDITTGIDRHLGGAAS